MRRNLSLSTSSIGAQQPYALMLCLPRRIQIAAALALSLLAPMAARSQAMPDAAAVARYATDRLDRELIDQKGAGLAVLVARGDELLFKTARGQASIELDVALHPEQRFRIGSLTKQFSAALLLRLIDQGKAALEDPLTKFLPQYPNGQAITLAMLLNHTSGIRSYTSLPGFWTNEARRDLSTAQIIDGFKDRSVEFAPGAKWSYNNSGYVLVGAVIESITGKPWWEGLSALKAPLFDAASAHLIPGHVTGYARSSDGKPAPAVLLSMTQAHAAGGLVGDLHSLWSWNQQLHEGGLLGPATYRRMTSPEGAAVNAKYGYGLFIDTLRGQRLIHHDGSVPGSFSALLLYMPAQRVTVVLLRNTEGGMNFFGLGAQLAAFAAGRAFPEPRPITLGIEQLMQFEGVYGQGNNTRTLRVVNGALTSQRSGGSAVPLTPVGTNRFAFPGVAQIEVNQNGTGKAVSLSFFVEGDGEAQVFARSGDLP
jgi:CubicO group peptidase (beta-lactamase class C family)